MRWLKKQPEAVPQGRAAERIAPAELPLPLDEALFAHHLQNLRQIAEVDAGLEAWLGALQAKHRLFAAALSPEALGGLDLEGLETVLDLSFTARRKLFPPLQALGEAGAVAALNDLLYGSGTVAVRLQRFLAALPVEAGIGREDAARLRRAAFDFAAETLHFSAPEQYPLMTRWVWDQTTMSGALRELIRGADHMARIELGSTPEMFEGARHWLASLLAAEGIYRDMPFWIDLVLAQAYSAYFRSVAEGMLSPGFGRGVGPEECIKKLLGIDAPGRSGRSRVRKTQAIHHERHELSTNGHE
jgi:hypothetical protein